MPRLVDVRHDGAQDLTVAVRGGEHPSLALPFPMIVDGQATRRVTIGPGWVRIGEGAPAAGVRDDAPVLDVLAGERVTLGPQSRILASTAGAAAAIRFSGLETPGGPATAEAIFLPGSEIRLQLLRLPLDLTAAPARDVRSGLGEDRVPLGSATAWTTRLTDDVPVLPLPRDGAPPSCGSAPGTWCDIADGQATSTVWISEGFDDGASSARGWSASGEWAPSDAWTCGAGATAQPGLAYYFGDPAWCAYSPGSSGDLVSPRFGPVAAGSQLRFMSRLHAETDRNGRPVDLALLLVDGVPAGLMPADLSPDAWYSFAFDLSPWAGRSVTVGFRFVSDARTENTGWFVDDVVAWDPSVGRPACVIGAGHAGATPCDARRETSWRFDEQQYCTGCQYSFYVLVECGREMHLPLRDMEGADVRVTNMLDPAAPVPLRCVNATALAMASGQAPPGFRMPDAFGQPLDCCGADGVAESWWGPPFDEVDGAGAGRVTWGLADGCPPLSAYDTAADGLTCSDLPATCGGMLDRLSPGEEQVMDCHLRDESGLCGLYRVDVLSGGHAWSLFANCDGTDTPQFPIFFDCTEAWAAFNPLPELAVAELAVSGSCPGLIVEFDVRNVGCAPTASDAVTRIRVSAADPAACPAGDLVEDVVVPAGLRPGEALRFQRSVRAACLPSLVEVSVDPDHAIAECTEVASSASCRAEQGVDSLARPACDCRAPVAADAGPDVAACAGSQVVLDGAASLLGGCVTPQWRWLAPDGTEAAAWGPNPALVVASLDCSLAGTWRLEVRCAGEPCTASDDVEVACLGASPPAEVQDDRMTRRGDGILVTWPVVAGASSYRVARGRIGDWYSHRAVDAGACDTRGESRLLLGPAGAEVAAWYVLVTALDPCGLEGPPGEGHGPLGAFARPARGSSADCP